MLLGRVIMGRNDAKEERLLMPDKMVLNQKKMGARLKNLSCNSSAVVATKGTLAPLRWVFPLPLKF